MNEDELQSKNEAQNVPEEAGEPTFGQPIEGDDDRSYEIRHQLAKAQKRREGFDRAKDAGQMAKDQAKKFLADKAKAAALQAIRSAAIAAWSWLSAAIGPYAAVIIIVLLLIVLLAGPAFAIWNKAGRGNWGNSSMSQASASEVQMAAGQSYTLRSPIDQWYWRQNDGRWEKVRVSGFSKNMGESGCAITSFAMIAKYYGWDITPDKFSKLCSNGLNQSCYMQQIVSYLAERGIQKKWKKVPMNLDAIKLELAKGNPIFAGGNKAFSSSGPHFVVIVGVENDSLILNDPMRGSGHRASWTNDKEKIDRLWVLDDK